MSSIRIAVTGANGFLGSALCRHLAARGHEVTGLLRRPSEAPPVPGPVRWRRFALPDGIEPEVLEGAEVLVHCAFETRFREARRAWAVNVEGSRRLFEVARARGVERIVFVSSLSAHDEAVSVYGRAKLEVEGFLDPMRDAAIRPGHIIGEGGVFWRTAASIRALPFIPLFFGGRQPIQTVALPEVCEAIRIVLERRLTGVLRLGEPEPLLLRDFYAAIARRVGRSARFVPLPGPPTLAALRIAERIGLHLPLSSDNLEGLRHLRAFETEPDLERLGMRLRGAVESLEQVRWSEL